MLFGGEEELTPVLAWLHGPGLYHVAVAEQRITPCSILPVVQWSRFQFKGADGNAVVAQWCLRNLQMSIVPLALDIEAICRLFCPFTSTEADFSPLARELRTFSCTWHVAIMTGA